MSSYFLKNYTTAEFIKTIQQFADRDKITLGASGKEVVNFKKGSLWAITAKEAYIQGDIRFQQIGNDVFCNIDFDRSKVWMVNAFGGFLYFILAIILAIVSNFQALELNIDVAIWTDVGAIFLVAVSMLVVFSELYLVSKAEKFFKESFELWYTNLL